MLQNIKYQYAEVGFSQTWITFIANLCSDPSIDADTYKLHLWDALAELKSFLAYGTE